ncbi:hypothetical protein [Polaromonas hydrogenivorans]|uniref:ATP-binding protein n=1 Tax=Polaromonas hydrogenivorans TaxID=335476 RepID=A0AAU7LSZ1_9BURK
MNPSEIRNLFEIALPEVAHAETTLELGHIYMPSGHYKAIALDRPLVVGDRGAGKSFWLKSLVDRRRRDLIGHVFGLPSLLSCEVITGFDPSATGNYPDPRELATLIQSGTEPSDIWHTVIVQAFLPAIIPPELDAWPDKINWVNTQSGAVAKQLRDKNAALVDEGKILLIAFDGLDRLANTWKSTIVLMRGLLQTQLDFSKYTNLRTKAFIRPDLLDDPEVRRFPDASKLVSLAVKLKWDAIDLYGLMWQYLANSSDITASASFRRFCEDFGLFKWSPSDGTLFFLSEEIKHDESRQQALFHKIAGKTMGGKTGGNTWTWLPNHLSDAHGYTSPRSFLVALRSAAIDSRKRKFVGPEYALHTSSIKEGVSSASEIRRHELEENLPWIKDIFEPLKGLALPSRRQDVVSRWRKAKTLDTLLSTSSSVPLPEKISETEPGSILLALQELGLCRMLDDGRVDFPDIVRVNAGMTRKGGVPVRR